jgi:hypothetical protein
MTIESDFKIAILDCGGKHEDLTQRREGAEPRRGSCRNGFGSPLVAARQTIGDAFGLCDFAPSRLGVEVDGIRQLSAVKAVAAKNHLCKSLIVNGVKPVSNRVKPLYEVHPTPGGQAVLTAPESVSADLLASPDSHPTQSNSANSLKPASTGLWSRIRGNIFLQCASLTWKKRIPYRRLWTMVPRGRLEAGVLSPKNGWRPLDSRLH